MPEVVDGLKVKGKGPNRVLPVRHLYNLFCQKLPTVALLWCGKSPVVRRLTHYYLVRAVAPGF